MTIEATVPALADLTWEGRGDAAPELDRFLEALQPSSMGPRLSAALSSEPGICRVLDAKYQPGVAATVLYEVDSRLVRADLLSPRRPTGIAAVPVVAPGLALYPFPEDPDLQSLPEVMNAARLGRELTEALGCEIGGRSASGPERCSVTLLRYRTGRRATVRAELLSTRRRFVAKVYHDPAKAAAVVEESEILGRVGTASRELRFARTAAWLPELSTVVQREVAGVPLTALLDTPRGPLPAATAAVRRAARVVAELHEARPVTNRRRQVERELRRFEERSHRIGAVDVVAGRALDSLTERLVAGLSQLPPAELGTVHGDCKPSQFMIGDMHVYLLDVDHLGVSDLATDVGTFMASLRQSAVRRLLARRSRGAGEAYGQLAEAFLEAYLEARSGAAEPARCRWQEAVALQRKALRAYARAPRSPLSLALTAAAHRCLDAWEGHA